MRKATPDNTNERGDQWNDENLSIFSRDQHGYRVELSAGSYWQESEHFRLLVDTLDQTGPVTFRCDPRKIYDGAHRTMARDEHDCG